jgi:hypothetical protein
MQQAWFRSLGFRGFWGKRLPGESVPLEGYPRPGWTADSRSGVANVKRFVRNVASQALCFHPARMKRLAHAAVPLTVIALALGACGDDDEPAEPAGGEAAIETTETAAAPDPCTLLDEAAVKDAVGTAAEGERDTQFGLDECAYEGEEPEQIGESLAALYVTLGDAAAFADYDKPELDAEPVEGIGEEAILLQGSSRATGGGTAGLTLVARTADRTVLVAWSQGGAPGDAAPDQNDLEQLTEQVLAGL